MKWLFSACVLLMLSGGCTRYEFDIVEPKEVAGRVGAEETRVVEGEAAEYRLRAAEGRLVVWLANRSEEPLELLGTQSYVVDPHGESHPLQGQSIAPQSFVKVILPPLRPVYRSSPHFGFGVGVGVSHYRGRHVHPHHFDDPIYDDPRYMTLVAGGDNVYWEWQGETTVRVRFVLRRGEKTLADEFVIQRVKARKN